MAYTRLYRWQAIGAKGKLHHGMLLSRNKISLIQTLQDQGLEPYRISSAMYITSRCWQGTALILFTRQLGTLLQSGLPITRALTLLAEEHPHIAWRAFLQEIVSHVSLGNQLSDALNLHSSLFPPLYIALIQVGESTGKLEQCCEQLARHLEQQLSLQKKIISALRYPFFICIIAGVVCLLMLMLVLPEFSKIYQSFNAPLPRLTQSLITLSHLLYQYGLEILFLCALCIIALYRYCTTNGKEQYQHILLHLPLIASLLQGRWLCHIFRTLSLTLQSGLPLLSGLEATENSVSHPSYQRALSQVRQDLLQGMTLHQAVMAVPIFQPLCVQLIRVGEESGMLEELMEKLANWYENDAHQKADSLAAMLEPIMMVILGSIVGTLVIAMYLPIFQLGNIMG